MQTDIETLVVGAGVVGLAIARALAQQGQEVLVAEQTSMIGSGTSSRNSEVIHAGIYYPAGSLKARLCVEGKHLLYDYCAARGVPHQRIGKLIVANGPGQVAGLAGIAERARANGVDDLQPLSGEQARAMEPALRCDAALLSPSTGIIDTHGLMLALQGEAEQAGAQCVFHTPVLGGQRRDDGAFLVDFGGDTPMQLSVRRVVNAAGLSAPRLASALPGAGAWLPQARYCKGSYFTLSGRAPFRHLIYPMPNVAGLGVHLTLDLAGQARFGPDTEWLDGEDYTLDPARGQVFYEAVRDYWPALPDDALQPGYTGIRPKISGPGEAAADFLIAGPGLHGEAGLVHLLGIESPGLTSCLALADQVQKLLRASP